MRLFRAGSGAAPSALILRSGLLAASRRMATSPVLRPSFETLASQAPQDEVRISLDRRSPPNRSVPTGRANARPMTGSAQPDDKLRRASRSMRRLALCQLLQRCEVTADERLFLRATPFLQFAL